MNPEIKPTPNAPETAPAIKQSTSTSPNPQAAFTPFCPGLLELPEIIPWHQPVDGIALLYELVRVLSRFVVLPKWAAETLALWILHTYAFQLRDVTTYLGIESPEHRCGKSTLITVLSDLAHRAVVTSNVSSPALFRVIAQLRPALLIDEADTFMHGNEELRGILNSGYLKKTAYVIRVAPDTRHASDSPASSSPVTCLPRQSQTEAGHSSPPQSRLASFSCWCPKVIARIGRLPTTLADRCIVFRLQRKTADEPCERLRSLKPDVLRQQCARFVLDHATAIAAAQPQIPTELNDRAADIWEPLLAIADLAGGPWPGLARQAAVTVTAATHDTNPVASLLLDTFLLFTEFKTERMFTRDLIQGLNSLPGRPWAEMLKGKAITDIWLGQQLRPYGIRTKTLWIGDLSAKGYLKDDFIEVCRRYVGRSDLDAFFAEFTPPQPAATDNAQPAPSATKS